MGVHAAANLRNLRPRVLKRCPAFWMGYRQADGQDWQMKGQFFDDGFGHFAYKEQLWKTQSKVQQIGNDPHEYFSPPSWDGPSRDSGSVLQSASEFSCSPCPICTSFLYRINSCARLSIDPVGRGAVRPRRRGENVRLFVRTG